MPISAVHKEAAGRKMQVAEKRVIAGTRDEGESLLSRRRATHPQTMSRQAFLKQHAETFLIVENEHRTACEKIRGRPNSTGGRGCRSRPFTKKPPEERCRSQRNAS